jgi:hypothetical protein
MITAGDKVCFMHINYSIYLLTTAVCILNLF